MNLCIEANRPALSVEQIRDKLQQSPAAEWVQRMQKFYQEHGYYRAEDLQRLLGDPTKPVEIGPNASLPRNFCPP